MEPTCITPVSSCQRLCSRRLTFNVRTNMKNEIRKFLGSKLILSIWTALILLLSLAFQYLWKVLPEEFRTRILGDPRLVLICILLAICLILALVICLLLKEKTLTPKGGVLWDKSGMPYCPACKSHVKFGCYIDGRDETIFNCITCGRGYADGKHSNNIAPENLIT